MNTQIVNLPFLNDTFPNLANDLIDRSGYIDAIITALDKNDIVFVNGDEGVGKTTLLAQFCQTHSMNSISHFVIPSLRITYNPQCIEYNLLNQIYYYCNGKQLEIDSNVSLDSITFDLYRKISYNQKNGTKLYFVFDGIGELSPDDINSLKYIFGSLPICKAKFIFSGEMESLYSLLPLKVKCKPLEIVKFSYPEAVSFFGDVCCSDINSMKEIYKISLNGQPDRISHIKRLCRDFGSVENFFNSEINEKTDLFDLDWRKYIESRTEDSDYILALIAFSDIKLDIDIVGKIKELSVEQTNKILNRICLLTISENSIVFISEKHKEFTKGKLKELKESVFRKLIEFYQENPQDKDSVFNLPNLYQKAQSWGELISFLNLETFIQIVENAQSIGSVRKQFEYGYDAARQLSNKKFDGNFMRFALYKSSINELEKSELWDSEIEACMALDNYERSIALVNSVFLKEDKLRLFATIAKQRKIKNLPEDKVLTETIKRLYNEIDFTLISEKGFEIAKLLMYTSFELCLEIIDNLTNKTAGNISTDQMYAFLSLSALEENKKNEHSLVDFDLISSKIKNDELKDITSTLKSLSSEFNADEMLIQVENIDSNPKKMFLLRNWIVENKEREGVVKMVEYAINLIISDSDKITPNATALSEIATPLRFIKDEDTVYRLVGLFDSQKNTITTPTRDFINLQLTIASSFFNFNKDKSIERFFDVYLYIDEEISDLSIKSDCLALMWKKLILVDSMNEIEKSISSKSSIEKQLQSKLSDLLLETAYHFRMLEPIIKTLVCQKPEFICKIIKNINTQSRKDQAYVLAATEYIRTIKIEKIDFKLISVFTSHISISVKKEDVLIALVKRFYKEKEKAIPFLEELKRNIPEIKQLSHIEERCHIIAMFVNVLCFDEENQKQTVQELIQHLKNSWDIIDVPWRKIELGFDIASNLAVSAKSDAQIFLNETTEIKQSENLSSSSNVSTYMLSTKLCIRAFGGLVKAKIDTNAELVLLEEIIGNVHSYGEELKLWNKVALHFYANNCIDKFSNIAKNYISTLVGRLDKKDKAFYEHIVYQISPSIFLYNQHLYKDLIKDLNVEMKDFSIDSICDFVFTKYCYEESCDYSEDGYLLEYSEYLNLIELLKIVDSDVLFYDITKKITLSIHKNRNRLISNEQKNSLKDKLLELIPTKLPYKNGIVHDGYLIACKALVLSIDGYNKKKNEWDDLIKQASTRIINLSDKAFVLTLLAISVDVKKVKSDLLEKSFESIKKISSIYDKSNRYDSSLIEWLNIDNGQFTKHLKTAYEEILKNKDGSINNIKSLIDVAQQHDAKLAEEMVNMLDIDPARLKYKDAIQRRLDKNKRIDVAKKDYNKLDTLNSEELNSLFNKNITQLNNGKITSRNIIETYPIIERISILPLSESYSLSAFFIENTIKKQETNTAYSDALKSLFQATYENAKLISILSADSILKMKKIYKFSKKEVHNNPVIRYGEKEMAEDYIKSWIKDNVKKELIIIDPYFTENDLNWLMLIKEINSNIEIRILTSRLSNNNSSINNKEVYSSAWKRISAENPPETSISIVWDKANNKCPFHDRWWVADNCNAGLHVNSISGLGFRDSQIFSMDQESLIGVESIIDDYVYKRVKSVAGFNLKYESFELNED